MSIFKKEYDAKKLYSCYIKYDDLGYSAVTVKTAKTVVYQVGDIYYDMRRVFPITHLSEKPHGDFQLYYKKDEPTYPSFYGGDKKCEIVDGSLDLFYKDGREKFTLNEIIKDMVDDPDIYTSWPGFSTEVADDEKQGKYGSKK